MDSTRAYQGYAGNCTFHLIDELERSIIGETKPNFTLIFDLDPAVGLARAHSRGGSADDRYERKGLEFHQRLRNGFLAIAKAEPQRCKLIDASRSIDDVSEQIWQSLRG
jgi:dTMP kinase